MMMICMSDSDNQDDTVIAFKPKHIQQQQQQQVDFKYNGWMEKTKQIII